MLINLGVKMRSRSGHRQLAVYSHRVMGNIIEITSKFDGPSQHGSFTKHMWCRYRWWVVLRSLLCIAAIFFGATLIEPGTKVGAFGGFLMMVGSLGFMRPMLWQMWHERGLRKHPAYETEVHYEFSNDGIKMSGVAGDANVPWSGFHQVRETRKGLLIYQDKKQYLWIPKADFQPGQMQEIAMMKQAAGV